MAGLCVYLRRTLLFALGHWLLWLFAGFFEVAPDVSAFYPAPALTMAFIALYGARYLPAVFVSIYLAPFTLDEFINHDLFGLCTELRQTLVYGAAGMLFRRTPFLTLPLRSSRDVAWSLVVQVGASGVSALLAAATFHYLAMFPTSQIPEIALSFWAGDASGTIMLFPFVVRLLINATSCKLRALFPFDEIARHRSFLPLALSSVVVPFVGFGVSAYGMGAQGFGYIIILPVVWFGATRGLYGGCGAALISNITSVLAYQVFDVQNYAAVELQTLFAMSSAIGMIVGAAFDDRSEAQRVAIAREKQLARLSRLAAVGELAASIAHEISTPLQVATTNIQLLGRHRDAASSEDVHDRHTKVERALERIAAIQRRVRDMVSDTQDRFVPIDLRTAVDGALDMLEHDIAADAISVHHRRPAVEYRVVGDMTQLEQLFVNLFKNAFNAMARTTGSRRLMVDYGIASAGWVSVSVSDTGNGVRPEDRDRIFEVLVSDTPGGLGMGLPICKTIVEGMGGNILVESDGQSGSTFKITLPLLEAR